MDDPRYCHLRDLRHPELGCITAAFIYRPEEKVLLAGFSFCSPWDQFDRSLGRLISKNRLKNQPILINDAKVAANGKLDVVETLLSYIYGVLSRKGDLFSALGVKMYGYCGDSDRRENFRPWVRDLILSQRSLNCVS